MNGENEEGTDKTMMMMMMIKEEKITKEGETPPNNTHIVKEDNRWVRSGH